jgi:hypothetical protein
VRAVPPDSFIDRQDVKFGWGVEPFNLADVVETDDGTNLFNRENAVTSGGIVTWADDAGDRLRRRDARGVGIALRRLRRPSSRLPTPTPSSSSSATG